MMNKGEERLLHSFGQTDPHGEAILIGNRKGLSALKDAIEAALDTGKGSCVLMPCDGENYEFQILMNEEDWQNPFWQKMAVPYCEFTELEGDVLGPDAYIDYNLMRSEEIPSVVKQMEADRKYSDEMTKKMREYMQKNNHE